MNKEILKGWISKILLGIINPHTSLKEALIMIEDISKLQIFLFHGLRAMKVWNTKAKGGF